MQSAQVRAAPISRHRVLLRPIEMSRAWRATLIALTLVGALAAAGSGLVYASPYSPLLVAGAVGALVVLVAWLRRPVWALYAALFVVLLPEGIIAQQMQSTLNRFLTMAALAVWSVDAVVRRRRVVLTGATMLMLGFLIWSAITLLWVEDTMRATTILQVYVLRLVLFLFLMPNEIVEQEHLDGLMAILSLSCWVLVVTGARTALQQGYTAGTRLQVLDQNENTTGTLALVALTGVFWQALRPGGHSVLWKLQAAVLLPLAVALTAMSGSRGSAISFVVTLLVMCLWKRTRSWGVIGLSILAIGLIAAPFVFSTTVERFAVTQDDTLLGGREALWQAGWMLIRDQPLQGVGIGNAPYAALPYVMLWRSVLGRDLVSLHNPPLTVWAETGILGLALYLGILSTTIAGFVKRYRELRRQDDGLLGSYFPVASAVFVGYMCSWIKGGGMESCYSYFLMLALLLVPSSLQQAGSVAVTRESGAAVPEATSDGEAPRP